LLFRGTHVPRLLDVPAEEESNIGFHEVQRVVGVNRGFGAWGDMVITLDGGEKLEMRSVPEYVPNHSFTMFQDLHLSLLALYPP
jgi:hypothetical protein